VLQELVNGDLIPSLKELNKDGLWDIDSNKEDWMLLLQLGSEDRVGFSLGCYGILYFCILKEDLGARRFDRVMLVGLARHF